MRIRRHSSGQVVVEYLLMVAVTVGALIIIGAVFRASIPLIFKAAMQAIGSTYDSGGRTSSSGSFSGGASSGDGDPVDFRFAGFHFGKKYTGVAAFDKDQGKPVLTDLVWAANAWDILPKVTK